MAHCSSYDLFGSEPEYLALVQRAFNEKSDKGVCRCSIRAMKDVYGSGLRKFMETTRWFSGEFLSAEFVCDKFKCYEWHEEVYSFLSCIFESYNDNKEFKIRKLPVKNWRTHAARKKHLSAFLQQGNREIRKYSPLMITPEQKERLKAARQAMMIFNVISRTYFIRKLPRNIPVDLYKECVKNDNTFEQYYDIYEKRAVLSTDGRRYRKMNEGLGKFSNEIIWLFICYFMHLEYYSSLSV